MVAQSPQGAQSEPRANLKNSYQKVNEAKRIVNAGLRLLATTSSKREIDSAQECASSALKVLPEESYDMWGEDVERLGMIRVHIEFVFWLARNWTNRNHNRSDREWRRRLNQRWDK